MLCIFNTTLRDAEYAVCVVLRRWRNERFGGVREFGHREVGTGSVRESDNNITITFRVVVRPWVR